MRLPAVAWDGRRPAVTTRPNRLRPRFPRSVYRDGDEPDPRFTLANERTFLAWMRTSLALLASGVALEALDVPVRADVRLAAAGVFVALGLLATAQAWFGWMETERALRVGRPIPPAAGAPVLAVGVAVAIALIAAGYLLTDAI
jgi:putative membrane protein